MRHSERMLEVAAVGPTDRVLDVGCGTGETTRASRGGQGHVVGVDLSSAVLHGPWRAPPRKASPTSSSCRPTRRCTRSSPSFDIVVSRFGVMFFGDPVAAFTNIARATAPGGRLAAVVWQDFARNQWVTEPWAALAMGRAIPTPPAGSVGPFGLADPDHVRSVLGAAGFTNVQLEDLASFWFGADADRRVRVRRGPRRGPRSAAGPHSRRAGGGRSADLRAVDRIAAVPTASPSAPGHGRSARFG